MYYNKQRKKPKSSNGRLRFFDGDHPADGPHILHSQVPCITEVMDIAVDPPQNHALAEHSFHLIRAVQHSDFMLPEAG